MRLEAVVNGELVRADMSCCGEKLHKSRVSFVLSSTRR
jgi:hypothetical protein